MTNLDQYFDIRPMGIEICPGITPPESAFEELIKYLATDNDNIRWKIASACNHWQRRYRKQAYILAASWLDCKPSTVEQWCHIERNVPYNARVEGLTIWFHKAVATVKDSYMQRQYLEICKANGWAISSFEEWLTKEGIKVEERHLLSDKEFEEEQEVYQVKTENADLKRNTATLESTIEVLQARIIETPQFSDPPADLPAYVIHAVESLHSYLSDTDEGQQYISVTITRDGERWTA